MIRAVLDTNVLVSGILSEHGPPAKMLDLLLGGMLLPIIEPRIVAEYRDVLARPRLSLDQAQVKRLLGVFEAISIPVAAPSWPHSLPDAGDEAFMAAAHQDTAILVTGKLAHYPADRREGVKVMNPRDSWEFLQRRPG